MSTASKYLTTYPYSIIGQRLGLEVFAMLVLLKKIVATLITILIALTVVDSFFGLPAMTDTVANHSIFSLIILGIVLAVLGLLSAISHHSVIRLGAINRAEFYGVLVAINGILFQWMLHMSNRVDQIMILLAK